MRALLLATCAAVGLSACVVTALPDLSARYAALLPSVAIVELPNGQGHGSGAFIAPGVVLTAKHVSDLGAVSVRLATGESAPTTPLADFPAQDAALLRTSAPGRVAPLDCAPLHAGQPVIVAGSPLAIEFMFTAGWVGGGKLAGGRGDAQGPLYVILDTTIAGGNSGGPVFNSAGAIVGFADALPQQAVNAPFGAFGVPVNGLAAIIPASAFCDDVRKALAQ